jgi:hypothetical protein
MPITKKVVFALNIDLTKKRERIIIGEEEAVRKYMLTGADEDFFFSSGRNLGLLLQDFIPIASNMAEIKAILMDNTGKHKTNMLYGAESALLSMYDSENPVSMFVALAMWQEYNRALSDKAARENILDTMDDITLCLRFNLIDDVLRWQKDSLHNPIECITGDIISTDYRKHPLSMYFANDKYASEYVVSDTSLLPLVVYYLKQIYGAGKYVQICPMCGKAFVAKTAGMKTLCSDKCKREQLRLNKKKFDDRTRDISYERASKNTYMYWYNKVKKLRSMNLPKKEMDKLETAFATFVEKSNRLKKEVIIHYTPAEEYEAWLLRKRNEVDDIIDQMEVK